VTVIPAIETSNKTGTIESAEVSTTTITTPIPLRANYPRDGTLTPKSISVPAADG
jgi:hypothetical protein